MLSRRAFRQRRPALCNRVEALEAALRSVLDAADKFGMSCPAEVRATLEGDES